LKKKYLIFFISFSAVINTVFSKEYANPTSRYQVKDTVKSIDSKKLTKHLRAFVRCCAPNRMVGGAGHKKVAPFLKEYIKRLDTSKSGKLSVDEYLVDTSKAIKLYENDFKQEISTKYKNTDPIYIKWRKFTDSMTSEIAARKNIKGHNVIWEKKGRTKPNDILVIGAHFDTIANDPETLILKPDANMPGADDNGSGVAIALSMIEVFSKMNLPITVRIVFFDWEELGFLGSYAYVQKYKDEFKKKNFLGYINLEMLGHDSKVSDKTKKFRNMRVYTRPDNKDRILASKITDAAKKQSTGVKFSIVENSFNSSDHINFWDEGFPAITFSQDWENDFNKKRYHSSNDFVETINFKTFYRSYLYITSGVLGYLLDIK
jgi:Zn-dependent M28 family amino/carboxypeptidase